MAPCLVDLPTEIVESIASYLLPENPEKHLHEYKTSSIFSLRLASVQLAAKSQHVFAKTYFNCRIYHCIESKLERLALIARDRTFHSYLKSVSLILLPTPGALQLDNPIIIRALNGLPNLERLDLLTTWTDKLTECSIPSPELRLPRLTQLKVTNIGFDTTNLAHFLERHQAINWLDLNNVRIFSGSYDDILRAAWRIMNLRQFALSRRYEGPANLRRWTYPLPAMCDLYAAEETGRYWAEDDFEMRLGSMGCTIRAASQERMRDGIEILLEKHKECTESSKAQVRGQLAQYFPSFSRTELQNMALALEAQRNGAERKQDVQVYSSGICSIALIPH